MNPMRALRQLLHVEPAGDARQHAAEMKRLELVFIVVRWLAVPFILLMAWLHNPSSKLAMVILAVVLALGNMAVHLFNPRIRSLKAQRTLSAAMLTFDALVAWTAFFLFARDFYTSAYAGFVFIIIEGAVRFGLAGSLAMALVFALGLSGAFLYRQEVYNTRFSASGYAFWTILILLVSVAIGLIVHEWHRQRERSERYLREKTLIAERNRMAREMHDSVLKTLQGLALETRALKSSASSRPASVERTAVYIEEVCQRTSREIRETIFGLRSADETEAVGLWLPRMLNEWGKTIRVTVECHMSGEGVTLPPDHNRSLRKVVSEALTNIGRHASASHVRAELRVSSGRMDLEITDNGCGAGCSTEDIPRLLAESKMGIAGMKERVEMIGGWLSLSGDGSGTRVRVSIPLGATNTYSELGADE